MVAARLTNSQPARRSEARVRRSSFGLPFLLAYRDLKDEVLLSLCLISAIAAVLAPIMVLAGLKFGFIQILRDKLIQDPSFRLITPTESQTRPSSFFERLRTKPGVAFVQPNINLSGTSARIERERGETFDIMPTGSGDPLIIENRGVIPEGNELTLTRAGAQALEANVGDQVKLIVTRVSSGRREIQTVPLKVRSILSPAADVEKRAYVPLGLVQDIERFRLGLPVVTRGWMGRSAPPQQSFDAVVVALAEPLDEGDVIELRVRNGFAISKVMTADEFVATTTLAAPEAAAQIIHLHQTNKTVTGQQISALVAYLGDRKSWLLPLVESSSVDVGGGSGTFRLRTYDPIKFKVEAEGTAFESWRGWRADLSYTLVERVLIPRTLAAARGFKAGDKLRLTLVPASPDAATRDLSLPVVVDGIVDRPDILVHPGLAGMLLEARNVKLTFEETLSTLVSADPGFRGFRAYGRSIDDIPGIVRDLQKEGVEVRAKADAIEQLQRLDAALTWITLIVAAVALLGGTAVLVASFYAAVERKKGELSLLRLLGFSRFGIFSLPVLQSIMLSGAGVLAALVLFGVFARVINTQFATDLTVRGEICRLELDHLAAFGLSTIAIAVMSSLLAARQTLLIDPAEALRQE